MRNFFTTKKQEHVTKKLSVILSIIFSLSIVFMIACGNPQDDDADLILHLGGGSGSYSASAVLEHWPPTDGTELASLKYEVTLTGPSGELVERKDIPGDSGEISFTKLSTGYWTIKVEAFSDGQLYAYSFTARTLKRGKNNVPMMMQRAGIYKDIIIAISPLEVEVSKGGSQLFNAAAIGHSPDKADHSAFKWSVEGANSSSTKFSPAYSLGSSPVTLVVGADETASKFTVTAESINSCIEEPVFGIAVVNVVDVVNAQTPLITNPPQSVTYTLGSGAVTLSVSANVSDGGTLSYQWYSNASNSTTGGTPVGTDSDSYSYTPGSGTAGTTTYYYVQVTNTIPNNGDGGTKTATCASNTAAVTVNNLVNAGQPTISTHPTGGVTYVQSAAATALSVTAASPDSGTLTYQWYSNTANNTTSGTSLGSTAQAATYTPSTATTGTLYYYVVVTNTTTNNGDGGTKTATRASNTAAVTVAEPVAKVTISGTSTNYATLDAAISSVTSGEATITVLKNITSQTPIIISGSKTINLVCDTACTIQLASGSLFTLESGATLRIGDASADSGAQSLGELTLKGISGNTFSLIQVSGGTTLKLYSNAIITGNTRSGNGGGVYVSGTFTMYGGTIKGNTGVNGGAVYTSGTFTMYGGTIEGNTATGNGGGVYVSTLTFTMAGGTIYGTDGSGYTPSGVSNSATNGESIYVYGGTAKYGGSYGTGSISTTDYTLPPNGTPANPFLIGDATDLAKIGTGDWGLGKCYKLTNNITLSGTWTPIASGGDFTGVFDGNGKTINFSGITFSGGNTGLFRGTSGVNCEIKNLRLTGTIAGGAETRFGVLVGYQSGGTIRNVSSSVSVTVEFNGSLVNYGGLTGITCGTIENSYCTGSIQVTNNNAGSNNDSYVNVGGIAGGRGGGYKPTVTNCWASGAIKATNNRSSDNPVGDMAAGISPDGNIINCVALNPSVTLTTVNLYNAGRVSASSTGTLNNNYAKSMTVTINSAAKTLVTGVGAVDGVTITGVEESTQSWWTNTGTGPGWTFGGTGESNPWKWDSTYSRPILWFETSVNQ